MISPKGRQVAKPGQTGSASESPQYSPLTLHPRQLQTCVAGAGHTGRMAEREITP